MLSHQNKTFYHEQHGINKTWTLFKIKKISLGPLVEFFYPLRKRKHIHS